jgi:hypothetical protein
VCVPDWSVWLTPAVSPATRSWYDSSVRTYYERMPVSAGR